MTTAYLAISTLQNSKIPVDQLKIFLTCVNQRALKEYSNITGIYRGKKNLTTNELINLVINGNNANDNDKCTELTIDEVNNILVDTQS